MARPRIGELLLEAKAITADQLDQALAAQDASGKKLGQLLIERGWVGEGQLTQSLSLQLSIPWVSLYHIDFSRQLLNRIPRELADKYCLVPIYVRHVKGQGETLYVAMDDPSNEQALEEVRQAANLPARPMIASASDIRSAIRVYYGAGIDAATSSAGQPPTTRPDTPVTRPDTPVTKGDAKPDAQVTKPERAPEKPPLPAKASGTMGAVAAPKPPVAPPAKSDVDAKVPPPPSSETELRSEELLAAEPAPPTVVDGQSRGGAEHDGDPVSIDLTRKKGPRMVALTLLDGTTINLPAQKSRPSSMPPPPGSIPDQLTARDLISALRAVAHGADASEILGREHRLEPILAATLSLLLRKGLIADWEFVEELHKF